MANLKKTLFDIERALVARGQPQMDQATLREAATRISHPAVVQALDSGQLTAEQLAMEIMEARRGMLAGPAPEFVQEGGLINDRTGLASQQLRRQGFRVQPQLVRQP